MKLDKKLRSIYSWKIELQARTAGSAASVSASIPALFPLLVEILSARDWPEKKIKFTAKGSNQSWAMGRNLQHWQQEKLAGDKWGKLPSLQVWECLLIGVGGEPATNLTENLGMGVPKGWNGLPTHPCRLGNCACVQEGHRKCSMHVESMSAHCHMQYSCELL